MRNIIAYNVVAQYNLGGPSILHGLEELLDELYGDDYKLTYIQLSPVLPRSVSDMRFESVGFDDFRVKPFLKDIFKYKLHRSGIRKTDAEILERVKKADIVIDLFGICFCDNFNRNFKYNYPQMVVGTAARYPLAFAAKQLGVRSVKNTASFGPMKTKRNRKAAVFASHSIFDAMSAREEAGRRAMRNVGVRKEIITAPDIANIMKYERPQPDGKTRIGISTSHQIIRQWGSAEDYIVCIANLCRHISQTTDAEIILIPNECDPDSAYNDTDVSEEIIELLGDDGDRVSILNAADMTGTEIKNTIASCEVMVASRYHSCVAALSAGVPVLVIGWHNKYEELLHLYGQDGWMLSAEDCDTDKLIGRFDAFWAKRAELRETAVAAYPAVHDAVIAAGRRLLEG